MSSIAVGKVMEPLDTRAQERVSDAGDQGREGVGVVACGVRGLHFWFLFLPGTCSLRIS